MFSRIWYLLFLVHLIDQTFGKELKAKNEKFSSSLVDAHSFCESSDLELKNHFKRFIKHDHKIYFIFKHRIVFSELPNLLKDNKLTNLNDEFVDLNRFEIFNFNQQTNQEIDQPNLIPKNCKVFGYSFNQKTNQTLELYYETFDQLGNRIFDKVYKIDFNGNVLAERTELDKTPEFIKLLLFEDSKKATIQYMNSFVGIDSFGNDYHILIRLYQTDNQKTNLSILLQTDLTGKSKINNYTITIQNFKDLRPFILNLNQIEIGILEGLFIGIDKETFKINLINYSFTYGTKKNQNYLTIKDEIRLELDFKELLSCFVPFTDEQQIKGIFYDSKLFFIFVNRFYLRIENDLLLNEFRLQNVDYKTNAFELKYENDEIYSTIKFELLKSKWIKTYPKFSFFVPNDKDQFKISLDENRKLVLKKETKESNDLKNCLLQTLVIDKNLYCFSHKSYFDRSFLNKFKILNIFKNSFLEQIYKNQKLLFIFNYEHNQVVFLTETNLFLFKYDNFQIGTKKEIIFSNLTNYEPRIFKSCLLNCKNSIKKTITGQTNSDEINSDQTITSQISFNATDDKQKSNLKVSFPIVILIILIIIITIAIFYLIGQRNKKLKLKTSKRESLKLDLTPSGSNNQTLSNDSVTRQMKSEQSATLLSKSLQSNSSLIDATRPSSLLTPNLSSKRTSEQSKLEPVNSLSTFFKLNKGMKKRIAESKESTFLKVKKN